MISVKDIVAILDKVPMWKQLKELPARVETLEKRLDKLENRQNSAGELCPKCKNETFALVSTEPDPMFGKMGVHLRTYHCASCGFEETKSIDSFSS